jgi:hypothetical protein
MKFEILTLTQQTTALLEVFSQQKENVDAEIATAVAASENAALEPVVTVAKNLIDTQTIFVNYIIS